MHATLQNARECVTGKGKKKEKEGTVKNWRIEKKKRTRGCNTPKSRKNSRLLIIAIIIYIYIYIYIYYIYYIQNSKSIIIRWIRVTASFTLVRIIIIIITTETHKQTLCHSPQTETPKQNKCLVFQLYSYVHIQLRKNTFFFFARVCMYNKRRECVRSIRRDSDMVRRIQYTGKITVWKE